MGKLRMPSSIRISIADPAEEASTKEFVILRVGGDEAFAKKLKELFVDGREQEEAIDKKSVRVKGTNAEFLMRPTIDQGDWVAIVEIEHYAYTRKVRPLRHPVLRRRGRRPS